MPANEEKTWDPDETTAFDERSLTQFAAKAITLASAFDHVFGKRRLGSCALEIAAPEGYTTGGGKQGVQHIALVPGGAKRIVIGWANHGTMEAELRTYRYLAALQNRRAPGTPLPFDVVAYDKLLSELKKFFDGMDMLVKVVTSTEPDVDVTPSNPWKVAFIVSLSAAVVTIAALVLRLTR